MWIAKVKGEIYRYDSYSELAADYPEEEQGKQQGQTIEVKSFMYVARWYQIGIEKYIPFFETEVEAIQFLNNIKQLFGNKVWDMHVTKEEV